VTEPLFIHRRQDATPGGALPTRMIQQANRLLSEGGFVLLPSDTCYSLAALAVHDETYATINAVLRRPQLPLSVVFPSLRRAEQFVEISDTARTLFERFTPGPITVVSPATGRVPPRFLTHAISSARGTIGARISDSIVERDVAASTAYPLITAAVRDPGAGSAVRDFAEAFDIVRSGTEGGRVSWGAIEGPIHFPDHSTVVGVVDERVHLIREGYIPFSEILESLRETSLSHSATEDRE
jgi:L-threonylcarbamoyladenylate synthase